MNRNDPSPENPEPLGGETADGQQLAKIEQQLKARRPRAPELDVNAILRAAPSVDQPVVPAATTAVQHDRRGYPWVGTITLSWTCGAVIGAAMTFVLLSRVVPPETTDAVPAAMNAKLPEAGQGNEHVAVVDDMPPADSDQPLPSTPRWSRSERLVAAMLLDAYGPGGPPYADAWPPLRAGDSVRQHVRSQPWRYRYATNLPPRNNAATSAAKNAASYDLAPHAAPARAVTRDQLLRELLNSGPNSIL